MTDVAGVVIGAVAIASLFSTCIELFDRFELGLHHRKGHQLACGKIELLRLRLANWGEALGVPELNWDQSPALQPHLTAHYNTVSRSLAEIRTILGIASTLGAKHQPDSKRQGKFGASIFDRVRRSSAHLQQGSIDPVGAKGFVGLRKRMLWAVHDKQQFDHLIHDLSFLIENLEKITLPSMSNTKKSLRMVSSSQPVTTEQSNETSSKKAASKRDIEDHGQSSKSAVSGTQSHTKEIIADTASFDKVYIHDQENRETLAVNGDALDPGAQSKSRKLYSGKQANNRTIAIQGDISPNIVMAWQPFDTRKDQRRPSH